MINTFSMGKTKLKYPALLLSNYHDEALPTMLDILQDDNGDLPVTLIHKDKTIKVATIRKDPYIIKRLLRVTSIEVLLSESKRVPINSVEELLELKDFIWTQ